MVRQPKTVSLSTDTTLIADKISHKYASGFSGWLRATLRQWDEDHDPVQVEITLAALRRAVAQQENSSDIFMLMLELKKQATLGDFE